MGRNMSRILVTIVWPFSSGANCVFYGLSGTLAFIIQLCVGTVDGLRVSIYEERLFQPNSLLHPTQSLVK
jgi:hypothetical protein